MQNLQTNRVDALSILELQSMTKTPSELYYRGNLELLNRTKIAIVGSRKPIAYTKKVTFELASEISKLGLVVVSGAAMGVDAIAHKGAGSTNSIAVMANGLDITYPVVNKSLIEDIEQNGLTLSLYKDSTKARSWSFVVRNEVVVALSDILIVTQADIDSGTMRSVEFALKMKKPIYVLPHRVGESKGSNLLLDEGKAKAIYDIQSFMNELKEIYGITENSYHDKDIEDELLLYFRENPSYESGVKKYAQEIFMYELEGKISIQNSQIIVL